MSWADAVNGLFEMGASIAILAHCFKLYKDKLLRGVSIGATAFFTSWGVWNLYYYPSLGQSISFVAGMAVVFTNVLWLGMMFHYSRRNV